MKKLATLLLLLSCLVWAQPVPLKRAYEALRNKDYSEALATADRLLNYEKDNQEALFIRGTSLFFLKRYPESKEALERHKELVPKHPKTNGLLGMIAEKQGDNATAITHYRESLTIKPDDPMVLTNLGKLLLIGQDNFRAEKLVRKSLELAPKQPQALLALGEILNESGRYEEAVATYDRAVALAPNTAMAYTNRGLAHSRLRHPAKARADFERALELQPKNRVAMINLANNYYWDGQHEVAEKLFDQVIALKVEPRALLDRGNNRRKLKRLEAALEDYNRALELDPEYSDAYVRRGQLKFYDLGQKIEGQADVVKGRKCNRDLGALASIVVVEAYMAYNSENYPKALELMDAIMPDESVATDQFKYFRGRTLHKLGRLEDALQQYQEIENGQKPARTAAAKGRALLGLSRFEEALESFKRAEGEVEDWEIVDALRFLDRHQEALQATPDGLSRAEVLLGLGRYEEALEILDPIAAKAERFESSIALGYRALALSRLGRWNDAQRSLTGSAANDPSTYWSACLYLENGQPTAAYKYFEREAKLDPDAPVPHTALAWCLYLEGREKESVQLLARFLERPNIWGDANTHIAAITAALLSGDESFLDKSAEHSQGSAWPGPLVRELKDPSSHGTYGSRQSTEVNFYRGLQAYQAGRTDEAKKRWKKVISEGDQLYIEPILARVLLARS